MVFFLDARGTNNHHGCPPVVRGACAMPCRSRRRPAAAGPAGEAATAHPHQGTCSQPLSRCTPRESTRIHVRINPPMLFPAFLPLGWAGQQQRESRQAAAGISTLLRRAGGRLRPSVGHPSDRPPAEHGVPVPCGGGPCDVTRRDDDDVLPLGRSSSIPPRAQPRT